MRENDTTDTPMSSDAADVEYLPASYLEVFLQPGEVYWGKGNTRIGTLLGSCVSIVVWHPLLRVGGMSHIVLPFGGLDPRYADGAMHSLLREMEKEKTHPAEYTARIFGGSDMLSGITHAPGHIGTENVMAAYSALEKAGIDVTTGDIGGPNYRRLIFDIWSGHVWMRKKEATPDQAQRPFETG